MTDYTKSTNFATKDALPTGDSGKIVRGTEIDTEFTNIQTANNSKADKSSPTFTGTATFDGLTATGTVTLGATALTATAVELNVLDGITSSTAELNILDGVTATASEINVLDGITATTAELNKIDGFTGVVADLNYAKDLRATGVTAAEYDYLDGVTSNLQAQLNAKQATIDDTDDVSEGTTNLYYTTSRANTAIDNRVTKSFVDALNINAAQVDGKSIAVVSSLPGSPDANTIYFVTGS